MVPVSNNSSKSLDRREDVTGSESQQKFGSFYLSSTADLYPLFTKI